MASQLNLDLSEITETINTHPDASSSSPSNSQNENPVAKISTHEVWNTRNETISYNEINSDDIDNSDTMDDNDSDSDNGWQRHQNQ